MFHRNQFMWALHRKHTQILCISTLYKYFAHDARSGWWWCAERGTRTRGKSHKRAIYWFKPFHTMIITRYHNANIGRPFARSPQWQWLHIPHNSTDKLCCVCVSLGIHKSSQSMQFVYCIYIYWKCVALNTKQLTHNTHTLECEQHTLQRCLMVLARLWPLVGVYIFACGLWTMMAFPMASELCNWCAKRPIVVSIALSWKSKRYSIYMNSDCEDMRSKCIVLICENEWSDSNLIANSIVELYWIYLDRDLNCVDV